MKLSSPKVDVEETTAFGKVRLESWHHVGTEKCPNCGNPYIWLDKGRNIRVKDTIIPQNDKDILIIYRNYCLVCKKEWRHSIFVWRYIKE